MSERILPGPVHTYSIFAHDKMIVKLIIPYKALKSKIG